VAPEVVGQALKTGQVQNVLFIRTDLKLGDALASTAMLNGMKRAYPSLSVHWLTSPYNRKAVVGHPLIHRLWVWNKKASFVSILRLWRDLRRQQFGLVVVAFSHTPSFTSFLIARSLGARWVWSYTSADEPWSRYLANVEMPLPPEPQNEVVKYANLLSALCGPEPAVPRYFPSQDDECWAVGYLSTLHVPPGQAIVALFPGGNANRSDRFWPPASWEELEKRLSQDKRYFVHFMNGPETDAIPFGRLAAFLRKVSLFVCSDGGTFHLAVASGAPTLGLFISTDAQRWTPPVAWASSMQAPDRQASRLTVSAVFEAISQRLVRTDTVASS